MTFKTYDLLRKLAKRPLPGIDEVCEVTYKKGYEDGKAYIARRICFEEGIPIDD